MGMEMGMLSEIKRRIKLNEMLVQCSNAIADI